LQLLHVSYLLAILQWPIFVVQLFVQPFLELRVLFLLLLFLRDLLRLFLWMPFPVRHVPEMLSPERPFLLRLSLWMLSPSPRVPLPPFLEKRVLWRLSPVRLSLSQLLPLRLFLSLLLLLLQQFFYQA